MSVNTMNDDHIAAMNSINAIIEILGLSDTLGISEQVAELKAQRDSLAAENGGLKESRQRLAEFIHEELDADYPLNMDIETPATDSFLAEVRAGAVDEVCLKISNAIINCYQDEQVGLDEAATICGDFSSEIRKGVQP